MVALQHSAWSSSARDGTLEIALAGEIDHANADDLFARLRLELEEVPAQVVVVNLSGVHFIDSSGLRLLLRSKTAAEGQGAAFLLRDLRPQAQRLLAISGLTEHFAKGVGQADPG